MLVTLRKRCNMLERRRVSANGGVSKRKRHMKLRRMTETEWEWTGKRDEEKILSPTNARARRKEKWWEKRMDAGERWLTAWLEVKFLICVTTSTCSPAKCTVFFRNCVWVFYLSLLLNDYLVSCCYMQPFFHSSNWNIEAYVQYVLHYKQTEVFSRKNIMCSKNHVTTAFVVQWCSLER